MINKKIRKPLCGMGVNDSDYVTQKTVNGKSVNCPFYRTWHNMMKRCYYEKYQEIQPTYKGCSVCEEWLTFSNFKEWMEEQDWEDKQLDKDLLVKGNKIYSPETCIFISKNLNSFTLDNESKRGEFPIGVTFNKKRGNFVARCRNPFNGVSEYLGAFDTPEEAHMAWKIRKHEHALTWSSKVKDPRLKQALQNRYKPY